MESNKVVLGYWGIRGLAERIRLILQYVGVAYTQKNYSNPNDWFGQDKPLLGTNCPLINLPYLQDGERVIAESDAIIAYLVLKNNPQLLGRNIQQRVDVVQLRGSFADFHRQYVTLVYGQNFEENKTKFLQTARTFLTKYSNFLGTKQYFVGGITVIDFLLAQFFDVLRALSPGLVQSFGNLNELTDRILGLPQIKAYRQSDRFIKSPYNGPSAAWGGKA